MLKNRQEQTKFTVIIEVHTTDGETQTRSVEIPGPCPIKDVLEAHGYPYDKHDILLSGLPADSDTVVGDTQTIALKAQKEQKAPTITVKERDQGS